MHPPLPLDAEQQKRRRGFYTAPFDSLNSFFYSYFSTRGSMFTQHLQPEMLPPEKSDHYPQRT